MKCMRIQLYHLGCELRDILVIREIKQNKAPDTLRPTDNKIKACMTALRYLKRKKIK